MRVFAAVDDGSQFVADGIGLQLYDHKEAEKSHFANGTAAGAETSKNQAAKCKNVWPW